MSSLDGVMTFTPEAEQAQNNVTAFKRLKNALHSLYCFLSFAQASLLIDKAEKRTLNVDSAREVHPNDCDPKQLLHRFESLYKPNRKRKHESSRDVLCALFKMEWVGLILALIWLFLETILRMVMGLTPRINIIHLFAYTSPCSVYAGMRMRTALMAAIHKKVLTLNASSMTRISTGYVINLLSNDLRKFELGMPYCCYLIFGPVEAIAVVIMVSKVLGPAPAFAGMSCILVLIPAQLILSEYVARYRSKVAGFTDKRVNLTGEVISGSLAVKVLGWEESLIADVTSIREREHRQLLFKNFISGAKVALPNITHVFAVCATFITYRFTDGEFHTPDVFFALSLMSLPRLSLAYLSLYAVEYASEMVIACRRTDGLLKIESPPPVGQDLEEKNKGSVEIINGQFGWPVDTDEKKSVKNLKRKETPLPVTNKAVELVGRRDPVLNQTLFDITLTVTPGELVGIVGTVGSGKTSILGAMLNDMENMTDGNGGPQLIGKVAYCAQTPWLISGTVRDNILFGLPYEKDFYRQVISACAFDVDLAKFPRRDGQEVGERGFNLSGGQKARLALARAVYSRADIYLLDDPLSAVDSKVARILFDRCIGPDGLLKNATRILVTHQRQYLPLCDRTAVIDNGRIDAMGNWSVIAEHPTLVATSQETKQQEEGSSSEIERPTDSALNDEFEAEEEAPEPKGRRQSAQSRLRSSLEGVANRLVRLETSRFGNLERGVFRRYAKHIGVVPFLLSTGILIAGITLFFFAEWWVARWASADDDDQTKLHWIWFLIAFAVISSLASLVAIITLFALMVQGSTRLHEAMLRRVMFAPLSFFHMNPTGRIVNRFAKDLGILDEELPHIAIDCLKHTLVLAGTFVLVAIALPLMSIFFVVVLVIFWYIRRRFVTVSREIRRYDGNTRSPVFAMVTANIKGLATIRAFNKGEMFQAKFTEAADLNATWLSAVLVAGRWAAVKMDTISAFIMLFSIIFAIVFADQLPPNVLGLALTHAIGLSGVFQWAMRQTAELENAMTAAERTLRYTEIDQEPLRVSQGGMEAPEGWPSQGKITLSSVSASYRANLHPVLDDLTFTIPGGSSVGIVGRTGSGKSSLLLALYRLIEVEFGEIEIDGVDTTSIAIDALRKHLAVIPQDPMLFGGTLRTNLDPWNRQSEAKIWDVLRQVHLEGFAKRIGGLDAAVAESGSNLSTGQRQLLCLARALLTDAKILALDEATANVDRDTDALIQESLRQLITGREKTLLIIAHRLDTIMDCDLLIVLDGGELVQFGTPKELMNAGTGIFAEMIKASKNAARIGQSGKST